MIELAEVTESPNERMVFLVRSATHPKQRYRVDLTAHNGYGECICVDWGTRRGPAIKKGEPIGTRATMCRHVIAARNYFLNGLLRAMAESETQKPTS